MGICSQLFGLKPIRPAESADAMEYVMAQRPLQRVLAFSGCSIDDVVNCPIAKRRVLGYYKLHRWAQRETEIGELERQWNPV